MARRNGMQRVYIRDIGNIVPPTTRQPLPPGIDLDKLTTRELFSLGVQCGISVQELIGVDSCNDHFTKYTKLAGNKLPDGYNWAEHVIYCNSCWEYFRLIRLPA